MSFFKKLFSKKEDEIYNNEDFWNWFSQNEKQFFNTVKKKANLEKDFFNKLSPKLDKVKTGIFFVTGMFDDNTVELIFSADGNIKTITFIEDLVLAAPAITGWKFTCLKQPLRVEDVSITMADYNFNKHNIYFYYEMETSFPDEISITIVHNDYNEENKTAIINGCYIFLDNFIGELNFVTTIDNVDFIEKQNAKEKLIPIEKLKDYLIWREKEFVEKYEGKKYNIENDGHSVIEGVAENGAPIVAIINTEILEWDSKASHPWVVCVEIKYDGKNNNGLPDNKSMAFFEKLQNEIEDILQAQDGYLSIGRETSNDVREIYFACKDFRKPSKVLYATINKHKQDVQMDFSIYKDKYWRTFDRFTNIASEEEMDED